MSVAVGQLGPNDAGATQALVSKFHGSAVSQPYFEKLLSDPRTLFVVAEEGTEIVGFIWAHWLGRLRLEQEHLFVYEVEVARKHQREGIGTKLMRAVISEARSRKTDAFVFTNHSNKPAVSFYKHLGGRIKNGNGDDGSHSLLFVYPADIGP